jgi:hypothetical protein
VSLVRKDEQREGGPPSRLPVTVLAVALVLLTVLAYWRAPGSDFIGDDYVRITAMEHYLEQGFGESVVNILPDRPFLVATILFNYSLGGLDPRGYKILSLLLHAGVGLTFFALLLLLQKSLFSKADPLLPALTAALFLVHPLNSQAILSSIQRGVILASLGGLGSFLLFLEYVESKRRVHLLGALLLFTLGVLSKPFVIALPFIILLYLRMKGESLRHYLAPILPFFAISLLPIVPYHVLGVNRQESPDAPLWYEYLSIQSRVVWGYLRLFFAPANLRFTYEIDPDPSLTANLTWLAMAGHLLVLAAAVRAFRGHLLFGFGILAMYLAFLPESGIFPIYHLAFEHRAYFPMLFFLLALFGLLRLFDVSSRRAAAVLVPMVLLFSFLTAARIGEVDTHEKWAINSYSYRTPGRESNLILLHDLYAAGAFATAHDYGLAMWESDKAFVPYTLFLRILAYDSDGEPPLSQRETLALVRKALLNRGEAFLENDQASVHNFLTFLVNRAPEHYEDPLAFQRDMEPVFRNQLRDFLLQPSLFHGQVRLHQSNLAQLQGHYERSLAAGPLDRESFVQYLNVLGQLSLYHPGNRKELSDRAESLKARHPGWAWMVDESRSTYARLAESLGL